MIRSSAILGHAKGQPCQLRIVPCHPDLMATVFAHHNSGDFGKGMGIKAHDIAGCFACVWCHMALDLHTHGLSDADLYRALLRATVNTWVILIEDEIIRLPRDKPKERKIKPRKPRADRVKIQSAKTIPSRSFQKRGKP